ncbi:MAG: hypothetical protein IJD86_02700 [Clostridia bacterium]|nr:hypothetical protein [Clostridia bacterium]
MESFPLLPKIKLNVSEAGFSENYVVINEDESVLTAEADELWRISCLRIYMGSSLEMHFAFEQGHEKEWTGYYAEITAHALTAQRLRTSVKSRTSLPIHRPGRR